MSTATAAPIRASERPLQRIAVDRPTLEHLGLSDPALESLALADLAVRMDGSATFGGEVSSDTFTTTGTATFGGRVFLEKSGRGKGLNHGLVSGTVEIPVLNGQVHHYSLSGSTTFQVDGTPLSPSEYIGMTQLVIVDHDGNSVTWDTTSQTLLRAPGGNNPSGTGRCLYALTCYDISLATQMVWTVALVAEDLGDLP